MTRQKNLPSTFPVDFRRFLQLPSLSRREFGLLPKRPGIYLYFDLNDRLLYVGKAEVVRKLQPKYNSELKDDKSFLRVKIGKTYFGPCEVLNLKYKNNFRIEGHDISHIFRDESHRFAQSYHRLLRKKKMVE